MARIISPFLGGLLAVRDLRLPYLVSAIMALTSCVLTKLICPETLPESKRKPLSIKAANPISFIGPHRNQSWLLLASSLGFYSQQQRLSVSLMWG